MDQQLPKRIKSSVFLEQFLGMYSVQEAKARASYEAARTLAFSPLLPSYNSTSEDETKRLQEMQSRESRDGSVHCRIPPLTATLRFNPDDSKAFPSINFLEYDKRSLHMALSKESVKYYKHKPLENSCARIVDKTKDCSELKEKVLLIEQQNTKKLAPTPDMGDKPTEAQLKAVYDSLCNNLPHMFYKTLDYTIFTHDIVYINNIRGVTTTNILGYVRQMAYLKIVGHLKYAYVKFNILKITMHPDEGTVKVRWSISGIKGSKIFLSFWKFKFWKIKEGIDKFQTSWIDGFSIYYVRGNGKVYKHVADRVMPDEYREKEKLKPPITGNVALFVGLSEQPYIRKLQAQRQAWLKTLLFPLERIK